MSGGEYFTWYTRPPHHLVHTRLGILPGGLPKGGDGDGDGYDLQAVPTEDEATVCAADPPALAALLREDPRPAARLEGDTIVHYFPSYRTGYYKRLYSKTHRVDYRVSHIIRHAQILSKYILLDSPGKKYIVFIIVYY